MASLLYCFPYSYRSSNFCDSNSCRSFTLLKALVKNKGRVITLERKPSKKKKRTDTKKDTKRIKSDNFTRSNREKTPNMTDLQFYDHLSLGLFLNFLTFLNIQSFIFSNIAIAILDFSLLLLVK